MLRRSYAKDSGIFLVDPEYLHDRRGVYVLCEGNIRHFCNGAATSGYPSTIYVLCDSGSSKKNSRDTLVFHSVQVRATVAYSIGLRDFSAEWEEK